MKCRTCTNVCWNDGNDGKDFGPSAIDVREHCQWRYSFRLSDFVTFVADKVGTTASDSSTLPSCAKSELPTWLSAKQNDSEYRRHRLSELQRRDLDCHSFRPPRL